MTDGLPSPADRTLGALWHAAGRTALDPRKRLLALGGVAWSGPVLLLGSFLVGAVTLDGRVHSIARPVAYVFEPFWRAYRGDHDGALALFVVVQLALLSLLWGYFGGALARLAAVDLTGTGPEPGRVALAYVRRHALAFLGAPMLLLVAAAGPLALAGAAALLTRLPGVLGDVSTPLAIVVVVAASFLAVVSGSLAMAGAFVARASVAADGADMLDAVSRPYTYALAGLPRLVSVRLLFLGGVVLGAGWRLLRLAALALVVASLLEVGLGPARWTRLTAVLAAFGTPPDAGRLGIGTADLAAAAAVGLIAVALGMLWLADLASRVACARMAAFLWLRRVVDRTPLDRVDSPPSALRPKTAEEAGFVEVTRVGTS